MKSTMMMMMMMMMMMQIELQQAEERLLPTSVSCREEIWRLPWLF